MSDLAEPHVMPQVSTWNVTKDRRIIGWQTEPEEEEDDDYTSEEDFVFFNLIHSGVACLKVNAFYEARKALRASFTCYPS